jgi:GNAT superfamily N-acetyltransferase
MGRARTEVREASDEDAEALARLCTQLGYPAESTDMPARLEKLSADPNARILVATDGNDVVGFATVHLRNTMNHPTPIAQLTLLVVDERARGRGVGRVLVEHAESWARERGARRIAVTTALDRAGAHAFYERIGYTHTGRRYAKTFPPPLS